ncbi:MAG: patatin-like phospholipase family protein [Alphaproteobacteria bacterium]|nr:patatin-like phospholipase family protein [Alphaproteobacteria bacterium]
MTRRTRPPPPASAKKAVCLALQGGGSHGAFTWGVLDEILRDGRIEIEAVSGASAGAVNAVLLADGLADGQRRVDRDLARDRLAGFWRAVADAARFSPIQRTVIDRLMGDWSLDRSPGFALFDLMGRVASPYLFNPLDLHPLKPILEDGVDFERVQRCRGFRLHLSATNVRTGRIALFERTAVTADHVLASACLPFLFQAVEIAGEAYWDGGYMGNPALFPFFRTCSSDDVLIVQINPLERPDLPRTAREIQERLNEITFNASLMREFRAIDFVTRLLEEGRLDPVQYKHVLIHMITDSEALAPLGASSKLNAEWEFLLHLRDAGRRAAEGWLAAHFDDLGERSTVDIRAIVDG